MKKVQSIIVGFFIGVWALQILYAQERKPKIQEEKAQLFRIEVPYQFHRIENSIPGFFHKPDPTINDYHFIHIFQGAPHKRDESIEAWKQEQLKLKQERNSEPEEEMPIDNQRTQTVYPQLGTNFQGNKFDGCYPPDNTLAYSPAGYIVSVTNCTIEYYSASGTKLYSKSLSAFFNNMYSAFLYDPVVIYDAGANRFIMVILHGTDPSTSKVLLCVSVSNNPQDGWYVYELPGDPISGNRWFDYPKLAVSGSDIFVSGNLFDSNDNFDETLLYQISKTPALTGQNITYAYWNGLTYSPFTLLPVSYGGNGNYGPGIYIVAVSRSANAIRLYDVTDDLSGNPTIQAYSVPVSNYTISIGANAEQANTSVLLDVGDTRALSGFYLNGTIHLVHNNGVGGGYNGILYHRIDVANLNDWASVFQESGYDCVYPSVAWFGTSTNDKTVLINYLRSSATIYPEHRVVVCDNSGQWSSSLLVKDGATYVDQGAGGGSNVARWGDYTGISRDHTNNFVWVSGCYGSNSPGNHAFNTWIAQIQPQGTASIEEIKNQVVQVKVYPNPAIEFVSIEFKVEEAKRVSISLIDEKGSIIHQFIKGDHLFAGSHEVKFNIKELSSGVYFLKVEDEMGHSIASKKIVVQ